MGPHDTLIKEDRHESLSARARRRSHLHLIAALRTARHKAAGRRDVVSTEIVNLNTATAAQIASLPGIGPKTADLVVQYRTKNGPFKKIEEIMNVRGIGEKSFLKIKDRLTVAAAAEIESEKVESRKWKVESGK